MNKKDIEYERYKIRKMCSRCERISLKNDKLLVCTNCVHINRLLIKKDE